MRLSSIDRLMSLRSLKVSLCFSFVAGCAFAEPVGFQLVSGEAAPPVHDESGAFVIQSGKSALIHWDSFSIDAAELVRFQQQNPSSYVLNRVVGLSESALLGQLQSNGAVYLVNPNGILIGSEAHIQTAGFIASTLDLLDADLSSQEFRFQGDSDKRVVNQGRISCPSGDIFLIARTVENSGELSAPNGRQGLLSGSDILIRPEGAPQVFIRSDEAVDQETLEENPYAMAIRHSGKSQAREVYIMAGTGLCKVSGEIAAEKGDVGGHVRLIGDEIVLLEQARVDVRGSKGGGEVLIGGDYQGKNPEIRNAKHVWLGKEAEVHADAVEAGDGGRVILWSDEATIAYGTITAEGGPLGGDGGLVEISSPGGLIPNAFVSTVAPRGKNGLLYLDPCAVTISTGSDANNSFASNAYSFSSSSATINIANLIQNLSNGNVTVDATASGSGTASITIANPITGAGGGTGGTSWTNNNLTLNGGNSVTVNSSSAISWSGTGLLTMTASSGAVLINSSITNSYNNSGTPFNAISMTAAGNTSQQYGIEFAGSLSTVDGNITCTGTSQGTVNLSVGIYLNSGHSVTTSGAGNISLTGTGSSGAGEYNDGLRIDGTTSIECTGTGSTGGSITLIGTASGVQGMGNGVNFGTSGGSSTFLVAGSSASLAIVGTGGGSSTTNPSVGVQVSSSTTTISAPNGGSITLFGVGGSSTSTVATIGVSLAGGTVSTSTGTINIAGNVVSGVSGGSSHGVNFGGAALTSTSGNINVSGTTSSSGSSSYGVNIGSSWSPGTTGTVTFGSSISNPTAGSPSTISGCVGGSGSSNHGINVGAAFSTGGPITATNLIKGGTGSGSVGFSSGFGFTTSGTNSSIQIIATTQATAGAGSRDYLTGGT